MLRISRASIYSDQSKKDELINQILDAIKHMYQMGKLWVQVTENNNDFIEKLNEKINIAFKVKLNKEKTEQDLCINLKWGLINTLCNLYENKIISEYKYNDLIVIDDE